MPTIGPIRVGTNVDDGQFRPDVIIPSWLASVASHVVMFCLITVMLRGCVTSGAVGPKAGDGSFREVGLHVKVAPGLAEPAAANEIANPAEAVRPDDGRPGQEQPSMLGEDAAVNELLKSSGKSGLPVLGPGPVRGTGGQTDATQWVKPTGRRSDDPSQTGGFGETTFFDVVAKGNRFVYVLDRSGSMYDHNAIRIAKEELVASLATLEQTQQFQVIFYNTNFVELRGADDRPQLQWATDINRTLARQFISSVQPDGGTEHMAPLKKALRYQPEHVFFLTDADQPILSARELNEIKTLNAGRSKIHCVEFGRGTELPGENFLKKLARENGGTYRYRDVTNFGPKRR